MTDWFNFRQTSHDILLFYKVAVKDNLEFSFEPHDARYTTRGAIFKV